MSDLKLRLVLHLLEDRLHLSRLHNIALDLQLARYEELLRVLLSSHQLRKVVVRKQKRHLWQHLSAVSSVWSWLIWALVSGV